MDRVVDSLVQILVIAVIFGPILILLPYLLKGGKKR